MSDIFLKIAGSLVTACPASGMGNAPLPVIVRGAPLEFTLKPVGFTFPACDTWTFIFNDRFGVQRTIRRFSYMGISRQLLAGHRRRDGWQSEQHDGRDCNSRHTGTGE